jgi:hypothetical protein
MDKVYCVYILTNERKTVLYTGVAIRDTLERGNLPASTPSHAAVSRLPAPDRQTAPKPQLGPVL